MFRSGVSHAYFKKRDILMCGKGTPPNLFSLFSFGIIPKKFALK